jgi:cytidylate kinase
MKNCPIITIDGASGTGKGTVGKMLAAVLGWHFLDSGAWYRIVALAMRQRSISFTQESVIAAIASAMEVQFVSSNADITQIFLEGKDVSDLIRTEELGKLASQIAVLPAVRNALLLRYRALAKPPGLVADGRDMGTVVFRSAKLKIFLTASIAERARRRKEQLQAQGINVNLSGIMANLQERDQRDQQRLIAPLQPDDSAVCIDTDTLQPMAVVQHIIMLLSADNMANLLV